MYWDEFYEEWLDEIENYSSRYERLLAEFEYPLDGKFEKWLKAAFEEGYKKGKENA